MLCPVQNCHKFVCLNCFDKCMYVCILVLLFNDDEISSMYLPKESIEISVQHLSTKAIPKKNEIFLAEGVETTNDEK